MGSWRPFPLSAETHWGHRRGKAQGPGPRHSPSPPWTPHCSTSPPLLPRDPVSASTTSLRAPWLNTRPESRPGSRPISALRLDLSLPPHSFETPPLCAPAIEGWVPRHTLLSLVVSLEGPSLLCWDCHGGLGLLTAGQSQPHRPVGLEPRHAFPACPSEFFS